MKFLESLQVFHGEANPARARVYARAARSPKHVGWRLTGRVTGPHRFAGSTLPATAPLRDLGPGPTLLAEAVVLDPCFWSPASPTYYEVEVAVQNDDGQTLATLVRPIGIRALGVRQTSFYLEGKRWVLRGVDHDCDSEAGVEAWREAWAALLAKAPAEELCRQASRQGVLVVAMVAGTVDEVTAELLRLSHWPAVAMAVVDGDEACDQAPLAAVAPNLVLGKRWAAQHTIPDWVQFVVAEVEQPADFAQQFVKLGRPVVAMRRNRGAADVQRARQACDELQRDLAPFGDWAGYVTLPAW